MNIDRLIGVIQEHFDNAQSYLTESKKKPYWKRTAAEDTHIRHLSTICDANNRELSNLCEILNLDWQKLYTIARLARRWEQAYKWERCFPVEAHEKAIADYIKKDDDKPWSLPRINYINWKINTGAYRKDYEWSLKRNAKTA